MHLGFGFRFEDLYELDGLRKIDQAFREYVELANSKALAQEELLDSFLAQLFLIEDQVNSLTKEHHELAVIYSCKRLFVQRRAVKEHAATNWSDYRPHSIQAELDFARNVMSWLAEPDKFAKQIADALKYAAWATLSEEGKRHHRDGVLFKLPKKIDPANLIATINEDGVIKSKYQTPRDGFGLTDKGVSLTHALDQANYCIFCHHQNKDSCSKGLVNKEGETKYKLSPFGEQLTGCPLEENISQMNELKSKGYSLAALATAIVDNPMLAATGHRICNDCMKACIYQKQEPVNIPKIETRVLSDVLDLPWGFEIYSLLTKWNPLNHDNPIVHKDSGYKVLVAGLGPAGFTLAHYLLNEGHQVVAIDGLKIEPLPPELSGITPEGKRVKFLPIKYIKDVFEDLDRRVAAGFGGVAEYGITVRWNKNYLKIIRLLLERRRNFRMYGGVRFGSNIDYKSAKKLGFDHIALALGAGKPNQIKLPNAVTGGVRMASDFLMALQLTGAARKDSIANLQIRLPILVVGGGLTAIDTACEAMSYYVRQVEKHKERYEDLVSKNGVEAVTKNYTNEDWQISNEFLQHAEIFAQERKEAEKEGRAPNFIEAINSLGGVNVVYRKKMTDAPSYRLNYEELELALEEGIGFIEEAVPTEVIVDTNNDIIGLKLDSGVILPVRSLFVAAGTSPNTILHREDPEHFALDKNYFRAIDEEGELVHLQRLCKPDHVNVITNIDDDNLAISFFGDLHPSFAGNVVKAMASAKRGYKEVTRVLAKRPRPLNSSAPMAEIPGQARDDKAGARDGKAGARDDSDRFFALLDNQLLAKIEAVIELAPNIIEVIIHSPLAAQNFQPGQFFRLQNYESNASGFATEGIAVTGAWVDKEKGLVSTIILEMGGSSSLLRDLKKGELVVLMGPTGHATEIKSGENVLLLGGGLGNAVLFSIAQAFKESGSNVLYFAGYKKAHDRYKIDEIKRYSDEVVWCCDEEKLGVDTTNEKSFHGNIVQALLAYARGELGPTMFDLRRVNRIIAIGSSHMMEAVNIARRTSLATILNKDHLAVASINSPMQCMMKEICAQCLQRHVDPVTGIETYVYSCANQDQDMNLVDFSHLHKRLKQNSLQEKITAQIIESKHIKPRRDC